MIEKTQESPATLVAIVVARRARDRELEHDARQKLEQEFGVRLIFSRQTEARQPHA